MWCQGFRMCLIRSQETQLLRSAMFFPMQPAHSGGGRGKGCVGSVISANMGSGCFRPTLASSCANHLHAQRASLLGRSHPPLQSEARTK